MTFASESVFQALNINIITFLNIPGRTQGGGGGGGGGGVTDPFPSILLVQVGCLLFSLRLIHKKERRLMNSLPQGPTKQFRVTLTGTSLRLFLYQPISSSNTRVSLLIMHALNRNTFWPIIILRLSKKNKEEGNILVGYRYSRYCYATALRVFCILIIITCAYDECISREREFPSYLINSLSATHIHTVHSHSIKFKYVIQQH
jgi:hypothetical protein